MNVRLSVPCTVAYFVLVHFIGQYTLPEAYERCSLVPGLISSVRAWERAWGQGYECCVALHKLLTLLILNLLCILFLLGSAQF